MQRELARLGIGVGRSLIPKQGHPKGQGTGVPGIGEAERTGLAQPSRGQSLMFLLPLKHPVGSREEMEAGASQRCSDQVRANTSGHKKFCFKIRPIYVLLLSFFKLQSAKC